ncbi:MAG TPA: hypothetical protein VK530_01780 [Candidatus Acidoferrum sp.]|nr:hypothetical protein [Candidatus Acidoferrum sp.]
MNDGDADTIAASLRCFILGLLSVVPVVGIVCALMSIAAYLGTSTDSWNPARRYARLGVLLAAAGLALQTTIVSIALAHKLLDG